MSNVEEIVFDEGDGSENEIVGHSYVEVKKHSIHGLPQYTEGQKLHPGIARDFLGTFDGWDYLQSIRDNARARQHEWIMVELRANGKVYGSPKLIHLKPRIENFDLPSTSRADYSPRYASDSDSRTDRLERLVYDIARGRRREARTHRRGGRTSVSDSGSNKDALYREMMEREREFNREMRERDREFFEERIRLLTTSEQKTTEEEINEGSALRLLLENPKVREKAVSSVSRLLDPDSAQQRHPLVEGLEMAFENSDKLVPLAQAAGTLISSLFRRTPQPQPMPPNFAPPQFVPQPLPMSPVAPAQQQPPAPVAQPVQQETVGTADEETTKALEFILGECKENAPARKSARAVVWLLDTFPQETAPLAVMLNLPGESICALLAAQLPQAPEAVAVLQMEHAPAWFDGLREAVAKRRNVKAVASNDSEQAEAKTA